MSWESFYLGCFWIGFLFSALSFLAGFGVLHIPSLHVQPGHGPGGGQNSPINFGTIVIFLAWFGATGYLLTRYSSIWALLALGIAGVSGLAGAAAMFWFLVKVVLADEKELDPADYEMVGVLGRVSSPVRSGGTGEMIFSQAGTRRSAAIRSENGETIPKGEEVVVTRFEKGVAWVRRWEELSETSGPRAADQ
jgi:membrane protein implicated in regulation of membrane protease activity